MAQAAREFATTQSGRVKPEMTLERFRWIEQQQRAGDQAAMIDWSEVSRAADGILTSLKQFDANSEPRAGELSLLSRGAFTRCPKAPSETCPATFAQGTHDPRRNRDARP